MAILLPLSQPTRFPVSGEFPTRVEEAQYTPIKKEKNSMGPNLCGQICMSVIAGLSVHDLWEAGGKTRRPQTSSQLASALIDTITKHGKGMGITEINARKYTFRTLMHEHCLMSPGGSWQSKSIYNTLRDQWHGNTITSLKIMHEACKHSGDELMVTCQINDKGSILQSGLITHWVIIHELDTNYNEAIVYNPFQNQFEVIPIGVFHSSFISSGAFGLQIGVRRNEEQK